MIRILVGDARRRLTELPDRSVQVVVTSPPFYGLRDYGTGEWVGGDPACSHTKAPKRSASSTLRQDRGTARLYTGEKADRLDVHYGARCARCGASRMDHQIGLEDTPEAYVAELVALFREIWRVLRDDGTVWLNLGDSYASSGGMGRGDNHFRIGRTHQQRGVRPGQTFDGVKKKDLIGIPWMVAFALRADGWYLRQEVIWNKPNPMPESVEDRCTKAHEQIFLLAKSGRATIWRSKDTFEWCSTPDHAQMISNPSKNPAVVKRRPMVRRWAEFDYYFDQHAIAEDAIYQPGGSHDDVLQGGFDDKGMIPGSNQRAFRAIRTKRNKRSVWTVATQPYAGAHFATFPPNLIEPCILASSPPGAVVLDPFGGAGTTALVADRLQREAILCELNPTYAAQAVARLRRDAGLLVHIELEQEKETAA